MRPHTGPVHIPVQCKLGQMEHTITQFVRVLRKANVEVSPAETLDAMVVLRRMGVTDRSALKHGLRLTLAKSKSEKDIFDVCFDRFFDPGPVKSSAVDISDAEDLVAVWKSSNGNRFQNYRSTFTILDSALIKRSWVEDIKNGKKLSSNCPDAWRKWVASGSLSQLPSESTVEYRSKGEQLPGDVKAHGLVSAIRDYFDNWPVGFESCAAQITRMMDSNFVSFELTRPSRDGGRDAIGEYRVGSECSSILVEFALEAKCYADSNSVGVRELSRLISRLRHRQFGILVTTSYVNSQAYREIKEDGHPIIVIAARDIARIVCSAGLNERAAVQSWLRANFPKG